MLPLPLAISLALTPELGDFTIPGILAVFLFGAIVGTVTHAYWLRTLFHEQAFYREFYEVNAFKPQRLNLDINKRHTRILLPFYAFNILIFFVILFVLGLLGLDFSYLLPFAFGALQGVPISYVLMEKGIVKA